MAAVDIVPVNINFNLPAYENTPQQNSIQLRTSTGADVVTTGGAFGLVIAPQPLAPNSGVGGALTQPTVTLLSYAAGITVLEIANTGLLDKATYNALLHFTPSGGTAQVVGTGTCTIS